MKNVRFKNIGKIFFTEVGIMPSKTHVQSVKLEFVMLSDSNAAARMFF